MKLCNESMLLSAASMNERMAADETPCASGPLRGSDVPGAEASDTLGIVMGPLFPRPGPRLGARLKPAQAISAMTRRSLIFCFPYRSSIDFFKRQMLREERQRLCLQAFGDAIQMIAVITLVKMRDAVIGQYFIQLLRRGGNAGVFRSRVHPDEFQPLQIRNVLMNHHERRVGALPRLNFGDRFAVAERQVDVERRVLGVRRPRC